MVSKAFSNPPSNVQYPLVSLLSLFSCKLVTSCELAIFSSLTRMVYLDYSYLLPLSLTTYWRCTHIFMVSKAFSSPSSKYMKRFSVWGVIFNFYEEERIFRNILVWGKNTAQVTKISIRVVTFRFFFGLFSVKNIFPKTRFLEF